MPRFRFALLTLAAVLAGCSDPAEPTANTKDFTATLPLKSSVWHTVSTVQPGVLKVALTNLSAGPVRLVIGDGAATCKPLAANAAASAGASLSINALTGSYCVTVSDPGQLTAPATYTLTVTYP